MRINLLHIFLFLFVFIYSSNLTGQLVISEIMYNPPESGTDSLEYFEITNVTDQDIAMAGYTISDGIEYSFDTEIIGANDILVLAKNASALANTLGITGMIQWTNGSLSNGGERLAISDPMEQVVDEVEYDDNMPWPDAADGDGYAIELCDLSLDNTDPLNWKLSNQTTNTNVNGTNIFGSPGLANNVACVAIAGPGDIVISEIMYHAYGAEDKLEFIELTNTSAELFNLEGMTLSDGIDHSFANMTFGPNQIMVLAKDGNTVSQLFNINALQWDSGDLSDTGELITLKNADGDVIDEVSYTNNLPWSDQADSTGRSLQLCDLKSDNNIAENWQASSELNTITYFDDPVIASPGQKGSCIFDISEITQNDAEGFGTFIGQQVRVKGVVYGNNLRPGGLQFTIIDINNDGVGVISLDHDFGYNVNETDVVIVEGVVEQFNGFLQVNVDTIVLESQNALQVGALETTVINETTESQLITIKDVRLVQNSEWTNTGSGFDVRVENGMDTFTIRIDRDVDLYGMGYPDGVFSVTGLGRQFDTSSPYDSGYQIAPRYVADISPFNPFVPTIPSYSIGIVNKENASGVADSLGVRCMISGIVYGVDLRGNGLSFTLIDDDHEGIVVFNLDEDFGYVVREGDRLEVIGEIDQFNGLTEIIAEEINFISLENPLLEAIPVSGLGEETESKLVRFQNMNFVDPSQWLGNGSGFNVDIADSQGNSFTLRIDNDVELSMMSIPTEPFNVTGLGGQFDLDEPYTDGYQIFPRYASDIESSSYTNDLDSSVDIQIYPNPVSHEIRIVSEKELDRFELTNIHGQKIRSGDFVHSIDAKDLLSGLYTLTLYLGEQSFTQKIVKN